MADSPSADTQETPLPSPEELLLLYQQSIDEIVGEMRVASGSIHPQIEHNKASVIKLYLQDILRKVTDLQRQLNKEQQITSQKKLEINSLKLEVKASKSDFVEMKSSLILEIEEQKVINDRYREELTLEKQSLQNALKQLMSDAQRKDEETKIMRKEFEDEIRELRGRIESINVASLKSLTQLEDASGEEHFRRNSLFEREKQLMVENYASVILKQRQELAHVIDSLTKEREGLGQQELIKALQEKEELVVKVHELQVQLLNKEELRDKYMESVKGELKKAKEHSQLLRLREEEIQESKLKVVKAVRDFSNKEAQLLEVRSALDKMMKEKEYNNKYLGSKWEHEIERMILNAELEFDREKNRLKKAAEERYTEIEQELGNKIKDLREEGAIKEVKLRAAISTVKDLETKVKELLKQMNSTEDALKEQLSQLTAVKGQHQLQIQRLNRDLASTRSVLEQVTAKLQCSSRQLLQVKAGMGQFRNNLEAHTREELQLQRDKLQAQNDAFKNATSASFDNMVRKYELEAKGKSHEQDRIIRVREEELYKEVARAKEQQEQELKTKMKLAEEEKEEAKKNFERMLRAAKYDFNRETDELNKLKYKLEAENKELRDIIKKRDEDITQLKLRVEEMQKERKIRQQKSEGAMKDKNDTIQAMSRQLKQQMDSYSLLKEELTVMTERHSQVKYKYDNIHAQIKDLRDYMIKQQAILIEKHDKIIKAYKSCIKEIEENCFSHSDRVTYVREIKKLKQINNDVTTDLANAQSKLITLKEVAKYQVTKMEATTHRSKGRHTFSEERLCGFRLDTAQSNFRNGVQRQDTNNYQSIGEFEIVNTNNGYEKLSRQKNRMGNAYQRSRMKRSKVGFTEIDTYSMLSTTKEQFRLNTSNSPDTMRQIRSALDK